MSVIKAKVRVAEDHSISGVLPKSFPVGEHDVLITLEDPSPPKFFNVDDLPKHDIPWDDSFSLRREDLYGDDGR